MNIEDSIIILKNIKKLVAIEWKHYITDTELSAIETLLIAYEKEKEHNSKLLEALNTVNHEKSVFIESYEKEKEKNKEYNMGIKNLISQIESAIDFMKTDKSKVKVDMYQQKEEDLKLEIVHLKKLLKEE